MSEIFKIAVMGIIQGIAEFLPISSSGHLVLLKHFLNVEFDQGILLEAVLHMGTLLSILVFYREKLWQLITDICSLEKSALTYAGFIVLSAIPAIAFYLILGDRIEEGFQSVTLVGSLLCVTGVVLLCSFFGNRMKPADKTWKKVLAIGCAQAFALLPGISRSGSTITTSRLMGIRPDDASEFSFLMSVPLLLGVTLLSIKDVVTGDVTVDASSGLALAIGFALSAVVGYFSIALLVKLLRKSKFWMFGIYCLAAGLLALIFGA